MSTNKLIDVYPYRYTELGAHEFLIFRRSKGMEYSGQWRMVGGKIEKGEKAYEAAYRELLEETGLKPRRFWTLPTVNSFYSSKNDCVYFIPAFAAEISHGESLSLNREHDDYQWVQPANISKRRVKS
jgi:dATP pyrophosphohydrolase